MNGQRTITTWILIEEFRDYFLNKNEAKNRQKTPKEPVVCLTRVDIEL